MNSAAPLELHRETVQPDWIDYNGHLNEAYYLVIFSHATDAVIDAIGLDDATRRRTGRSIYTLETHISYLEEVGAGAEVRVASQLLDLDEKRFHLFHAMYDCADDRLLAEAECMLLHVDMTGDMTGDTTGPRAAPFAPEVAERLQAIFAAHRTLPRPERAGRSVGIRRKAAKA